MSLAEVEAHQRKHGFVTEAPFNALQAPQAASKPLRGGKQPNKTESDFARYHFALTNHVLDFEPVKLRIGPNCYYAPDWGDLNAEKPEFYEVKGAHVWDDSLVKFKAAKERHTWANFEMWQKKQGTWSRLL